MTKSARYALFAVTFIAIEILLITFADRLVSDWARDLDSSNNGIINIFRIYTDFGKSKWYLWPSAFGMAVCCLACRLYHHPQFALAGRKLLFFFSAIAISGIVTDIIKPVLGRARPVEMVRNQFYGFKPFTFHAVMNGMPSGHATTAGALAIALCILFPRGKWVWITLGFALAVSRIMVNAHYLSDVLAGCAVGVLTTVALDRWYKCKGTFPIVYGIFPIDKESPHA